MAFDQNHDSPRADKNLGRIYQPIIESLGLPVDIFDAGALPYAYADKSFDVICRYRAIEPMPSSTNGALSWMSSAGSRASSSRLALSRLRVFCARMKHIWPKRAR